MISVHVKMAVNSLKSNKIRTFLTLMGIIIGVTAVTTIFGLGEGIKRRVNDEISSLGADLIGISPGKNEQTSNGLQDILNNRQTGANSLSPADLKSASEYENVKSVTGIMLLDGSIAKNTNKSSVRILGVDQNYLDVTNQKIADGQYFNKDLTNQKTTVISKTVAVKLFGAENPIGSSVTIRGVTFTIIGVLEDSKGYNFSSSAEDMVLVPINEAKALNQGNLTLQQISIKVIDAKQVSETAEAIKKVILVNHNGEEDFTVASQAQLLSSSNSVFRSLTSFTTAVASISLLVGGIGVMNIMLVTVTERTKEIGIRKAIGATKLQILMQFLVEALVITLAGGIIGIMISLIIGYIVGSQTTLKMAMDVKIIGLAALVSLVIGVIFGTWPALRAARKDPIESLRHD